MAAGQAGSRGGQSGNSARSSGLSTALVRSHALHYTLLHRVAAWPVGGGVFESATASKPDCYGWPQSDLRQGNNRRWPGFFPPSFMPFRLLSPCLRRPEKRQEMAQSHHCDNSVHLKRAFVSLVRKLLSFCGLAPAGSKPSRVPNAQFGFKD